jgi:hypothetical protein
MSLEIFGLPDTARQLGSVGHHVSNHYVLALDSPTLKFMSFQFDGELIVKQFGGVFSSDAIY